MNFLKDIVSIITRIIHRSKSNIILHELRDNTQFIIEMLRIYHCYDILTINIIRGSTLKRQLKIKSKKRFYYGYYGKTYIEWSIELNNI